MSMTDNYEQEHKKQIEANKKKIIRLIPSFIFIIAFIVLVIMARHKTFSGGEIANIYSSSTTAAEGEDGTEATESSTATRNTAVAEVLDIPETGDAQPASELSGAVVAEEGDGNIAISVVAWNPETNTITIRIDNNTADDITCTGQPTQIIDGQEVLMSAFKNSSTSMQAIPAGTYQCITYIVDENCFTCETLEFYGYLRWKVGHGTDKFAYSLPITFETDD